MPLSHTRTFRVRHYECDGYGHVNAVSYLRYMQEAAFDATAAAGYSAARYDQMGVMWLVRETDIEYFAPLKYGDTLEVKTWIADFRTVRSSRAYEMRNAATRELVAAAHTDWAYLDKSTFRPLQIPPELIAAFFPEGLPAQAPPRARFPAAPPPPPGVFVLRRRVEWRDIDPARHVNNAVYIAYLEDVGIRVCARYGWPDSRTSEAGFGIFARRHHIEYKQQAMMDDELEISTWVSDVRRATASRHYTITRPLDGALIAQAHSAYVWVDMQSGKPIRIPADFMADLSPNVVTSEAK